jgi:hypothetical protein
MKTLQEVRKEILMRLGFSDTQGHDNNKLLVNTIIEHAQSQLFFQYDFLQIRKTANKTISAGSSLYDYPTDCDYRRVVDVLVIDDNGYFKKMNQGISLNDENSKVRSIPSKFDVREGQIMISPVPDKTYTIRFEYYKKPSTLTMDSDRLTLDDEIVFALALIDAKNHYRMDSTIERQQFKAQLDKKQDASLGTKRFFRA